MWRGLSGPLEALALAARRGNGQIIAVSSESYGNREDCVNGAQLSVSTNAATPVVDLTLSATGSG